VSGKNSGAAVKSGWWQGKTPRYRKKAGGGWKKFQGNTPYSPPPGKCVALIRDMKRLSEILAETKPRKLGE